MPQISLYIDERTLRKIEGAAAREHTSISKWVAEQIKAKVEPAYPAGYEELFGALAHDELVRPDQGSCRTDTRREPL